jgi:acetyltransferase-like isoleucine patch superfamily enzyme
MLTVRLWRKASGLLNRWRVILAKLQGAALGQGAILGPSLDFELGYRAGSPGRISVGARSRIDHGSTLHAYGGRIEIGADAFLGSHVVVYGHGGVEIGDNCLIAMHSCILSSEHAIPEAGVPIRSQADRMFATSIGSDVWLGAGVKVLGGVTIGQGCVVGAGAVVTRDLPPNSIAVGVPARVIGYRSGGGGDPVAGSLTAKKAAMT